jgi:hypothetical protein
MRMFEPFHPHVVIEMMDGLTAEESVEFHGLDATVPYDGLPVWPDDLPRIDSEQRWLELWQKHQSAQSLIANAA